MLKVLKGILIAVGIVLIAATIVLTVWDVIQINQLVAVANANKSNQASFNSNPRNWILLGAAGALIGGFVLGFGLGIPKFTFKQRLQAKSDEEAKASTIPDPGL